MTADEHIKKLIDRMKSEILEDARKGVLPLDSVASFSDLHDYVDANGYGETYFVVLPYKGDDYLWALENIMSPAITSVDCWIRYGGLWDVIHNERGD